MTFDKFVKLVRECVARYVNDKLDITDKKKITPDEVYLVWYCKTLKNWKALASTPLCDGMYYEVTFNGEKNEYYLDAYKKWENRGFAYKEE